jgi:2-octaprenylphenol hydroxylase
MGTGHPSTDILVIGGGIVGLSTALAMRQRGFSVLLLDAGALNLSSTHNRVYALNHASISLLKSLAVWDKMDLTTLSPYRGMHVWDGSNHAAIDFDTRLLGKSELGFIVEEHDLQKVLLQQCHAEGVVLSANSRVQTLTIEPDAIIVHGERHYWTTNFLIISDGANSPTRTQLNIPMTTWPYHHHAIVATVKNEHAHQNTAYQVFHPDGPLAFLPLTSPHSCSIVWSTSPSKASTLMQLTDDAFNDALTDAFEHQLGKSCLISSRHSFPLHMRHVHQYVDKRWLLMGDAAHTIHPLAGLGLNVGLADLQAWLTLLDKSTTRTITTRTLSTYQRQRKHAVWQTIALMEGLKLLFANPLTPITTLRGIGMQIINDMSFLKRLFMEYAAGETIHAIK